MVSSHPYALITTRRVYNRSRKKKAAAPVVAHETASSQWPSPPMVPIGVTSIVRAAGWIEKNQSDRQESFFLIATGAHAFIQVPNQNRHFSPFFSAHRRSLGCLLNAQTSSRHTMLPPKYHPETPPRATGNRMVPPGYDQNDKKTDHISGQSSMGLSQQTIGPAWNVGSAPP